MALLTKKDLFSLEKYSDIRNEFRAKVMKHKKNRRLAFNDHAVLYFEDALTMQYQVQEMLRIERIFEAEGIQQELDVYNTLIPDGLNWKATFMIEYTDVKERKSALAKLIGIERSIWIKVEDSEKEAIENGIQELEEALKGEDKEEIDNKVKALSEASAPLAQRMYEEEAKSKESPDQEAQDSDSDVVDADFEEVTEEKESQNS